MKNKVEELIQEVEGFKTDNPTDLENFRIKFMGKKGVMTDLFKAFKEVPNDQKKEFGQLLNTLKEKAQAKHNSLKNTVGGDTKKVDRPIDLTLPVLNDKLGSRHPISLVRNEVIDIFSRIGYTVSEGPEIEDDWHNFSALNFPEEHPALSLIHI